MNSRQKKTKQNEKIAFNHAAKGMELDACARPAAVSGYSYEQPTLHRDDLLHYDITTTIIIYVDKIASAATCFISRHRAQAWVEADQIGKPPCDSK